MPLHPDQRVGVFVDVQNMYYSAKHMYNTKVNYANILKKAVAGRKLIRAIAYVIKADVKDEGDFFNALEKIGYDVREKDLQIFFGGAKKGDWDVGIAMDIMRLASKLDVIVLVSGDGDFKDLLEHVKSLGCRAEVIAFGKTSSSMIKAEADKFIDMEQNTGYFLIGDPTRHRPESARDKPTEQKSLVSEPAKAEVLGFVPELAVVVNDTATAGAANSENKELPAPIAEQGKETALPLQVKPETTASQFVRNERPRFDRNRNDNNIMNRPRFDNNRNERGDRPRFDNNRNERPRFDRNRSEGGDRPRFDRNRNDAPRFERHDSGNGEGRFNSDRGFGNNSDREVNPLQRINMEQPGTVMHKQEKKDQVMPFVQKSEEKKPAVKEVQKSLPPMIRGGTMPESLKDQTMQAPKEKKPAKKTQKKEAVEKKESPDKNKGKEKKSLLNKLISKVKNE
ncbi:MAG: NYN domain-containing protein [archaeon]